MNWLIWVILGIILWIVYNNYKKGKSRNLDHRGYERDGYGKLIHRKVAYNCLYDYPHTYNKRFGEYDIHHTDGNKLNNSPENLKILTRDEHKAIHRIY